VYLVVYVDFATIKENNYFPVQAQIRYYSYLNVLLIKKLPEKSKLPT